MYSDTQEIESYNALMREANIEIDREALIVIVQLIKLGVHSEDVYEGLKQIAPVCGLLKKCKLRPSKSVSSGSTR